MRVARMGVLLLLLSPSLVLAQLSSELVVSGLSLPVAVVQDPTLPDVRYVVEQGGRIRIVRAGVLQAADFLDLTPMVLSGGERGLLGLAFSPDYAVSGRLFVNYTRQPDGHTVVSRYRRSSADPLRADPASRFDLRWPNGNRFITQPFENHNAGDLVFGSDGKLYIPLGDGGSANDPDHRAQNPTELLGKILRIDTGVSDADPEGYDVPADNPFIGQALPEIWDFGLRNPFRVTVDRIDHGGTGALVIADVGQNAWEEIDYEPFGAGGLNYGWRNREGAHDNVTTRPPAFGPLVDPIAEYSHAVGNVITGGEVYRGSALGIGFFGRYFFADFGSRRIWSIGLTIDPITKDAQAGPMIEHTAALGGSAVVGNVSAFGIGADCEVYFLNWAAGQLRRIVDTTSTNAGCPTSPDPFLSSGGGVFVAGIWLPRTDPRVAGAGLGGSIGTGGVGAGGGTNPGGPGGSKRWRVRMHDGAAGLELGLRERWLGPAEPPARRGRRIQYRKRRIRYRPWRKHVRSAGWLFDAATGVRLGVREWRMGSARSPSGRTGIRPASRRRAGHSRGNDRLRWRRERVFDDTASVELGVCERRVGASRSSARARRRKLV